jgi:hypothetical protein
MDNKYGSSELFTNILCENPESDTSMGQAVEQ